MWKIDIKTDTCEDLVPNPNTCDMLERTYHMYEELVLNRQKMSVTKLWRIWIECEMQQIFFLYFVIVRNTYVYYMKLTSCVNFTKCEILVRNKWPIFRNNFSQAVRNWYLFFTVWNLRSVKYAVQRSLSTNFQCLVQITRISRIGCVAWQKQISNKANSLNLYFPMKGYLRESFKSQNLNTISPTPKLV